MVCRRQPRRRQRPTARAGLPRPRRPASPCCRRPAREQPSIVQRPDRRRRARRAVTGKPSSASLSPSPSASRASRPSSSCSDSGSHTSATRAAAGRQQRRARRAWGRQAAGRARRTSLCRGGGGEAAVRSRLPVLCATPSLCAARADEPGALPSWVGRASTADSHGDDAPDRIHGGCVSRRASGVWERAGGPELNYSLSVESLCEARRESVRASACTRSLRARSGGRPPRSRALASLLPSPHSLSPRHAEALL